MVTATSVAPARSPATVFLICGVLAPFAYVLTDVVAGLRYPGYSFTEQAPSELFAIGAPTSRLVVPFFSLSSALFVAFGVGMWRSSGGVRVLQVLAVLIAANGADSLALWQFPMHMRGATRTFTDMMHVILAVNPFVLLSIVAGIVAFRNWFRAYSIATLVILIILAAIAFSYVPAASVNRATPWLGLSERSGQYAHQLWHVVLAIVMIKGGAVVGDARSDEERHGDDDRHRG